MYHVVVLLYIVVSSGLTTVPEGHKLGKASTSNPHPEALPAAKQLQQLPACQMDTARGGAQRREKMEQSISLLSDAHDCLSSLPKWGMWRDWTISCITREKYEPLSHTLMPQTSGIQLCLLLSPPEKGTQITGSICCKTNHDWCVAFLGCRHMFTPIWDVQRKTFFAF